MNQVTANTPCDIKIKNGVNKNTRFDSTTDKVMAEVDTQNLNASHEDEVEDLIGPVPEKNDKKPRKRKRCDFEKVYLENLPCAESYEKSLMHRDVIGFVSFTKTSFLITASFSGNVKFWKKLMGDVEFVKQFRAHTNTIVDVSVSGDGLYYATISLDKTIKIFDVVNFDMINMFRLGYTPDKCCWMNRQEQPITTLAVSQADSGIIRIYDSKESSSLLKELNIHRSPITAIAGCTFPTKSVKWEYKTETDLFELLKTHCYALAIAVSNDGSKFAVFTSDKHLIIFWFKTGKKYKMFDESTITFIEDQQKNRHIPDFEFGRRLAVEKELEKTNCLGSMNLVINLVSNTCSRLIGKNESVRFLHISLYQGKPTKSKTSLTLEMQAAENPTLKGVVSDPTIVCTGFKKNRFYIFTRKESDQAENGENERDIFNEKPTRDEIAASTIFGTSKALPTNVTIHTGLGDIFCELYPKECPKAVENFVTHAKNNYYNDHIFHRIIKQFMIQTGDPNGDGTGGESIWGRDFDDEFHPKLKHDKAYCLCMANAGPNTNGSQFFITVSPTSWLDNKHTIFGKIIRGMEVA
ncbi:hypothetical protein MXB_1149, partial [Myxobolus squamalis]